MIIAYTIIGSKIDRAELFYRKETSTHEACEKAGPGPYCSTCGKLIELVDVAMLPVEGFEPEEGWHSQGKIGGLEILPVSCGDTHHFLVVDSWNVDDGGEPVQLDVVNIDDAREKVRAVLGPLGLWDPAAFGIWTALYYS